MTNDIAFLTELEAVIRSRRTAATDSSYTRTLFERGTAYIAQKVGEEGAICDDKNLSVTLFPFTSSR